MEFNQKQQKAVDALEKALMRCEKVGLRVLGADCLLVASADEVSRDDLPIGDMDSEVVEDHGAYYGAVWTG